MWRAAAIILALATSLHAAPATTQSTSRATTRASSHPTTKPITVASVITALLAECDSNAPRNQPDYFASHPAPPIEAIAPMLSRSFAADPRRDAYVRWQLLGTFPEKVEGMLANQLVDAYQSAPSLHARPDIDTKGKQQLDRAAQRAKKEQQSELQDQLNAEVERIAKLNTNALSFRADLYRRLPVSYDSLAAGFNDAKQRCAAGVDPKLFIKQLGSDLQTWGATSATPAQLNSMSRLFAELSQTEPTEYYDALEWTVTKSTGRLKWKKKKLSLNDRKQLEDLSEFVRQQLKNQPNEVSK